MVELLTFSTGNTGSEEESSRSWSLPKSHEPETESEGDGGVAAADGIVIGGMLLCDCGAGAKLPRVASYDLCEYALVDSRVVKCAHNE